MIKYFIKTLFNFKASYVYSSIGIATFNKSANNNKLIFKLC
jgi:hypothetical protein